jgi:hypothetical protein
MVTTMVSPVPSAPPVPSCPPRPAYPALLQAQVSHAGRLARTLCSLHAQATTGDAAFLWLEGRAEEVQVFTSDVLRAWSSGELPTGLAAGVIDGYLHALHVSLEGWYGQWFAPSCCGPLALPASGVRKRGESRPPRRADPLGDTMADAPPPVG